MSNEICRLVECSSCPRLTRTQLREVDRELKEATISSPKKDDGDLSTPQFIKDAMEVGFSMQDLLKAELELQVRDYNSKLGWTGGHRGVLGGQDYLGHG